MIFIKKFDHFCHLKKTGYHPTDGRTDRRTDGRTDTPLYRDGWTHLKRYTGAVELWSKSLHGSGKIILTLTEIPI